MDAATGSWLFDGHSGGFGIIAGTDGYLRVNLTAQEIAALLGKTFSDPIATNLFYNRRLFLTMITGCSAINGYLPIATGTPHGVKQEGNPWVRKTAFVGFISLSYPGEAKSRWASRIPRFQKPEIYPEKMFDYDLGMYSVQYRKKGSDPINQLNYPISFSIRATSPTTAVLVMYSHSGEP